MVIGSVAGCSSKKGQGAATGGAGGAATGAIIGTLAGGPLLGTLVGGAAGAGAGYLIGASQDKFAMQKSDEDRLKRDLADALTGARDDTITDEQVAKAVSADINNDGFVTIPEVLALQRTGYTDDDILQAVEEADVVLDLSRAQKGYLVEQNISTRVINGLDAINTDARQALARERGL